VALALAICLGGCAQRPDLTTPEGRHAAWMQRNCQTGETNDQCMARMGRELAASEEVQKTYPLREQQADELECRLQAQMAASNASVTGGIVGGAIYGVAAGNHIYATCMQMMAARRGY